ncbi:hypothetical protein N7462_000005 [Penicillium macrosclerotiorum]|uniref:uncharacterized protein n=1 Tax=Penicillium macrosclerotiorum TaxID=303699 RepID=UPI00254667B5|nr:uncharacterized protein N7462_000005 [Penicillium macrosclerotiorum]KAJ5698000.1 hypothetical protein N7462_000005 [Penicillium macrosclerotiorum]
MPFQQAKFDQYERPFDTLELLYRSIAATGVHFQKEQYLISSVIRLEREPSMTCLQQSWKVLRYQHPQIASEPNKTGTRLVYTVPSLEALEKWLQNTLVLHANETRPAESLDEDLLPSSLFTLHYLPLSRELLFRTPHWRTDGRGMILIQRDFLTLLAQGPQPALEFDGSEFSRIPPSLDEAVGISLEITDEMKRATETELSVLTIGPEPASIIQTLPNTRPKNSCRLSTRLSKDLTQRLVAASKVRGLTVTTAVQAALIVAVRPYMVPLHGRLVCFNTFDIRNCIPAPWSGSQGATALYHTGRPCSIDLSINENYDAIAAMLALHYQRDLQPLFKIMPYYVQSIGALLATSLEVAIRAPGAAHPELSSLGVIDDQLPTTYPGPETTLNIEDWWLGVQITNRVLQTYLWTREGQLHLTCHFNEAFYERNFVEKLLEEWKSKLVGELVPCG